MNVDIASRLAQLRKQYGYSQESLAEQLGISRQAVSKWERAEASPDTDNLITLARLYGVSLDDLLNTEKDVPRPATKEDDSGDGSHGNYGYSIEFNDEAGEDESDERADDEESGDDGFWDKIPKGGIHVEDGDNKVHIGWSGIHVIDKDGSKVNVSWKGVHVEDPDNEVHVGADSVYVKDADGKYRTKVGGEPISDDEKADDYSELENFVGDRQKNLFQRLPLGVISIIAFILIGSLTGQWHPAWMTFLLIPVVDTLITAIVKRDFHKFAYPVLALDVFLWIGFMHNLWHPGWVIFLTVPIYYAVFPNKERKRYIF